MNTNTLANCTRRCAFCDQELAGDQHCDLGCCCDDLTEDLKNLDSALAFVEDAADLAQTSQAAGAIEAMCYAVEMATDHGMFWGFEDLAACAADAIKDDCIDVTADDLAAAIAWLSVLESSDERTYAGEFLGLVLSLLA